MTVPVKVCSFLPAATNILVTLNLEHLIEGVTFECPIDKPRIIQSSIHDKNLSAIEINELISEHKKANTTVNSINEELLLKINPDVIFTQAICNVCQIGEEDVTSSLTKNKLHTKVFSLNPKSLDDVFENITTVATACGFSEKGVALVHSLKNEITTIQQKLTLHKKPIQNCSFFEWMDPLFNCGHWIPDQIKLSGAIDLLANPKGYSYPIDIKKEQDYNPETIIFSACGMSLKQSLEEVNTVLLDPFWHNLSAYKNKKIWLVDGNLFTQPGPDLVKGIKLLAAIHNPDTFPVPKELKQYLIHL